MKNNHIKLSKTIFYALYGFGLEGPQTVPLSILDFVDWLLFFMWERSLILLISPLISLFDTFV